jgi:hypothetical protein
MKVCALSVEADLQEGDEMEMLVESHECEDSVIFVNEFEFQTFIHDGSFVAHSVSPLSHD